MKFHIVSLFRQQNRNLEVVTEDFVIAKKTSTIATNPIPLPEESTIAREFALESENQEIHVEILSKHLLRFDVNSSDEESGKETDLREFDKETGMKTGELRQEIKSAAPESNEEVSSSPRRASLILSPQDKVREALSRRSSFVRLRTSSIDESGPNLNPESPSTPSKQRPFNFREVARELKQNSLHTPAKIEEGEEAQEGTSTTPSESRLVKDAHMNTEDQINTDAAISQRASPLKDVVTLFSDAKTLDRASDEKTCPEPIDLTQALKISQIVLSHYSHWRATEGLQCVAEVLPIITNFKGANHPLVSMLKEIQLHFHQPKRVRFYLEPTQSDRQQNIANNPDIDRLLVLKINDQMELDELRSRMVNKKSEEGNVKPAIHLSVDQLNVLQKVQEDNASFARVMKMGTLMIKLKKGEPTLRWMCLSKDQKFLTWRKPTSSEKKSGKPGGMPSFNKTHSVALEDITGVYCGINNTEGFARYTSVGGEPWLCFSFEVGKNNQFNLVCRTISDLQNWFMGLQALVCLSSVYMSAGHLMWQRLVMKANFYGMRFLADRQGVPVPARWRSMASSATVDPSVDAGNLGLFTSLLS